MGRKNQDYMDYYELLCRSHLISKACYNNYSCWNRVIELTPGRCASAWTLTNLFETLIKYSENFPLISP
jgi:hypothetical protein